MPVSLTDYDVKVGDQTITFRGPSDMSDDQIKLRAQQEYGFKSGRIPTTFAGGAMQSAGDTIADNSGKIGTAVSLAGGLGGQPEIVAAGPLVGRAVKAGGEYMGGRAITPTSIPELAVLGAEGAVGAYGPAAVVKAGKALTGALSELPGATLPQALAKGAANSVDISSLAAKATPKAVGAAFSADLKTLGDTAARMNAGVSAEDLKLFLDNVNNGMAPSTAAKIVGEGSAKKISALLTLLMRSRIK